MYFLLLMYYLNVYILELMHLNVLYTTQKRNNKNILFLIIKQNLKFCESRYQRFTSHSVDIL